MLKLDVTSRSRSSRSSKIYLLDVATIATAVTAAGRALDFLIYVLLFLVGIEIGVRKGKHVTKNGQSPLQSFVSFWLAGSPEADGKVRVNYSRATAFFGIVAFVTIAVVVLHKYEVAEKPDITPLIICLTAALAMLGINLGQFGIQQLTTVKMAQVNNSALVAPPTAPAAVSAATVEAVASPVAAQRRDSGVGATQLFPATPPPPGEAP